MKQLAFILWLIVIVALCGYTWGCEKPYPRVTYVYGCTDGGCRILKLTEDANGNQVVTPWEGHGK